MPSSTTLRSGASPLDTSQSVNVVPRRCIKDQLPRNIDDALINVSGITQANTLAGTQDAVIRRGFGDNRDGSIMRNGMPLVQGRSLNRRGRQRRGAEGAGLAALRHHGSRRHRQHHQQAPGALSARLGHAARLDLPCLETAPTALLDVTGPIGDRAWPIASSAMASARITGAISAATGRCWSNPSLAWYGEDTTVQLNYEHREFIYPFDRGTALIRHGAPLAIPADRRLDEPFNNMWGTSDLLQASVEHRFNENWKLYAGYSYNTETYSANQLRITGINFTTGVETRSNDGTQSSLSNVSYGTSYM